MTAWHDVRAPNEPEVWTPFGAFSEKRVQEKTGRRVLLNNGALVESFLAAPADELAERQAASPLARRRSPMAHGTVPLS